MAFSDIAYEIPRAHVAVVTLNRPETRNAYTNEMLDEIIVALDMARRDSEVRVVVITGAGKGFSSGHNTKKLGSSFDRPLVEQRYDLTDTVHKLMRAVYSFNKPLLAAVNGAAAGFGMELASWADIRFASDAATFEMSFAKHGVIPGGGGCFRLPRIVGLSRALDLIWRAPKIDAQEALKIGYVLDVFPSETFMESVLSYASEIAAGPAIALEVAKQLVHDGLEITNPLLALRQLEHSRMVVRTSDDAREGGRAASERRKPVFKGR